MPYPLVVQDRDLRTLLEIKPAEQDPVSELRQVPAGEAADEGIIVPTVRVLPPVEQPDLLVRDQEPPVARSAAYASSGAARCGGDLGGGDGGLSCLAVC